MREAEAGVVELDGPLPNGCLHGVQDTLSVAVRGRDEVDRRPGERRDQEQHVDRLARKTSEPTAEELTKAFRNRERAAGRRARPGADELTAELEGKERIAGSRLADTRQLRPRELEPYSPGGGRNPAFPHPLVCPSLLPPLEPNAEVAGLPAWRPEGDEPWLYDARLRVRRRA